MTHSRISAAGGVLVVACAVAAASVRPGRGDTAAGNNAANDLEPATAESEPAAGSLGPAGRLRTGSSGTVTDSSEHEPTIEAAGSVPTVDVVVVREVDQYTVGRSFTGSVVARRTSDLGFERSARVVALAVDEGDDVVAGQLLAKLDSRQIEIRKRQTLAQKQEAVAILEELRAGPRTETIEAARASLSDSIAQVELQRRNFDRLSKLLAQNAASIERFDSAELGLQSAQARRSVAEQQLEELEAGSRKERIKAQEAVVAQFDAILEDIEVDLADSALVAPYAGTVSHRHIDEGTVVAPSQSIFRLVESGALEARIGLPASVFSHLESGKQNQAVVDGQSFPVSFTRALPNVDLQTRTREAVFSFAPQAADSVVPGQVVRIEIGQERPTKGFWLPTTALIRSYRGLWAVYVAEGGADRDSFRIRRCDVEVLHSEGDQALVRGLLSDGDRVVRAGTHRVVPGQIVVVRSN